MIRWSVFAVACVTAGSTALPFVSAATADVLILESRVPSLKRGDQLSDNHRLTVPSGAYVKILRPGGDIQDIMGPYDRLVRDVTKGESLNSAIWNSIREQIAKEPAATRSGPTGGTRGGTR